MAFPELEETIGRCWHRWIGRAASYPRYPEAAVTLAELHARLTVFFRGLGGPGGVRLTACAPTRSSHRLNLRQRVGLGSSERLERPTLDGETLLLPERLEYFPEPAHNARLYFWLVAFFAHAVPQNPRCSDPLQGDILALRAAYTTTQRVLHDWPGLRAPYTALAAALCTLRPQRRLQGWEAAVEATMISLLGGAKPSHEGGRLVLATVLDAGAAVHPLSAPRGYRPFLPVPLWGEVLRRPSSASQRDGDDPGGGSSAAGDDRRRKARRRTCEQAERDDPLLLNRFENILCLAEMVNINRSIEDDDPETARRAASDLDEITVTRQRRKAATRLTLDLDLAPEAVTGEPLSADYTYPEWDYTRQTFRRNHCRVVAGPASEAGETWQPDAATRRRIRAVRRQFEALRPRRQLFPAQRDGDDLDLAALVRSYTDIKAGGVGSERVYTQVRSATRDLAVAILMDVSLSTDSWIDNHRVLDVEKEAVLALSHGLAACGDEHAIFTFTSRQRHWVNVQTVKPFDSPLNDAVERRLQALRPGYYTRIGAALRHVTENLRERPNRHRLLLLLSDGKPNDLDRYEGRYGIEDTRQAIREARRQGLRVFGLTVDSKARDYFPYLFGRGAYAIVSRISRLPAALPVIYRQLVG